MVIRLSLEKDRKIFFLTLLMVICCFEAILCRSLNDAVGPWQQWTGCSVSCGLGEQTRRRDCRQPHHQVERGMQTMYSDSGCHGNKSALIRRSCTMEPCSFFETKFDPLSTSSPPFSSSYLLRDPVEWISPEGQGEGYTAMSTHDGGCSVVNQEIVCSNSTNDDHARLKRAIRLSLGEMIHSNWTPWTTCSCTTSTHTRYRFCVVGKRQCVRAKGLFPTKETSYCQCGEAPGSRGGGRRNNRQFRRYPSERFDPYTSWSNWGRCPCERDAFRIRNRLCHPGREIACMERKQQTGLGTVQVKRCQRHRGCQGSGPMTDLFKQQERQMAPSEPEDVMPNGADASRLPIVPLTVASPPRPMAPVAPPPRPMAPVAPPPTPEPPVQPLMNWSTWSQWEPCSRTCGPATYHAYRWRECQDDYGDLVSGCKGDYIETDPCNIPLCPTIPPTSPPVTEDPSICRAYTSDVTGIGPRRRQTITTEDERSHAECPAYYGLAYERPTQPPRPPPPPVVQVVRTAFNIGRFLFG